MAQDVAVRGTSPTPDAFDTPAADLACEIGLTGSVCLPSAVTAEWLDTVRDYARAIVTGDEHEVMIEGATARDLPFMRELTGNPRLAALLESVAQAAYRRADPNDREIECTVRVINGPDPQEGPLWFHYDATVVTMVMPIVIPDAGPGQSGELVLCPNNRPFRRSVLANVIEKSVVQTDRYRRRFVRRLRWERDTETVSLTPGDAYLFYGYRSYHATLPARRDRRA